MRTVKINNVKIKVFEKRELKEKLRLNDNEIDVIMKYQKTFPELLQDDNGFCIDGETLCKELGIKSNFNDWLLRESKGKEGKLIKYRCVKNTDFICISEKSETQRRDGQRGIMVKNKISLTLNCAKKIAMRQNNEQGDLVCDYFILMEKTLRNYEKWIEVREPQKQGNKILMEELNKNYKENHNKEPHKFIYINENDMLNSCLLGYTAKEVRQLLEYEDKQTREHFDTEINNALKELQLIDQSLIISNMKYEQRKEIIKNTCDNKYKGLKEEFNKFCKNANIK